MPKLYESTNGEKSSKTLPAKVINLGDTTNSFGNYSDPTLGDESLDNYLNATENVPFSKRIEIFGNHDCMSIINATLTPIRQEQSFLYPYFKNVMARRTNNWGITQYQTRTST